MRMLKDQRGFTIVEMMVAVAILLGGALATLSMLDIANHQLRSAGDRQKATALAREVIEAAKAVPYRQISQAGLVGRLREDASIAGSSASPWRVTRDGTPMTVEAEVCWVDDAADGAGSHAAGGFCTSTNGGGTIDSNPVDFKRVTVTITWGNGSGRGTVRQSTLVTTRGGSDAPVIQSLRLTSPLDPLITSTTVQSATIAVTTGANAAAVVWSVDGVQKGSATGSGRNWVFIWQLPAQDGAYDVSAQTIEPAGGVGDPRSVTLVLNRFIPAAPANFVAGRNGTVVEAQWSASRDRDVVGYRVYRQASGGATLACSSTSGTSCVDTAPPAQSGTLEYWVVGIERVAGVEREGTPSARVNVNVANRPPEIPQGLTLSKDPEGNTVLKWQPAAVPDVDTGDFVSAYRIYRDGVALSNRQASAAGVDTTWTDTRAGGVSHQYWITAADSHLAESAPLGPVSG
jgi:prepilin-type N-terminal cleavage/methylation domain-containing protein